MFFPNSIDTKDVVEDPNGNLIVNLPVLPFYKHKEISSYSFKLVPSNYKMRPDLVALVELGSVNKCEYIMMFNQIGNPFSINEDDVLLIPDGAEADAIMIPYNSERERPSDSSVQNILVKNYYKYSSNHNLVDMSSYDDFMNLNIPSGNVEVNANSNPTVPYLLDDDEQAMVVKNGKIYFNSPNDVGLTEDMDNTDIDNTIQSILNDVATDLSCTNCTYNGTNLSDFIKALNNAENSL